MDVREPGNARADASSLNQSILDTFGDLAKQLGVIGHSMAADFGIAPSDLLALFKLDGALPMKELAQRMGCDASFITVVADALERKGLVKREPSQRDRRVKNLVLTPEGIAMKKRMMDELADKMPWCYGLDDTERQCFLTLLRKTVAAARSRAGDEATVRSE
jgi:MarR family transcriptional regulator, organic hydroperoxide resistance regulator